MTTIIFVPEDASDEQAEALRLCCCCNPAARARNERLDALEKAGLVDPESPTAFLDAVVVGRNRALGLPPELSAAEFSALAKKRSSRGDG